MERGYIACEDCMNYDGKYCLVFDEPMTLEEIAEFNRKFMYSVSEEYGGYNCPQYEEN